MVTNYSEPLIKLNDLIPKNYYKNTSTVYYKNNNPIISIDLINYQLISKLTTEIQFNQKTYKIPNTLIFKDKTKL